MDVRLVGQRSRLSALPLWPPRSAVSCCPTHPPLGQAELLEQGRVVIGGGQFVQVRVSPWAVPSAWYGRARLLRAAVGLSAQWRRQRRPEVFGKICWRCIAGTLPQYSPRHPLRNEKSAQLAMRRSGKTGRAVAVDLDAKGLIRFAAVFRASVSL